MLVDSHCHLDSVDDLDSVLRRAKSGGVGKIITVGTSIESIKKSIEIANKYSSGDLKTLRFSTTASTRKRIARNFVDFTSAPSIERPLFCPQ